MGYGDNGLLMLLMKGEKVKKPGSRGGHPWTDDGGVTWRYDDPPEGHIEREQRDDVERASLPGKKVPNAGKMLARVGPEKAVANLAENTQAVRAKLPLPRTPGEWRKNQLARLGEAPNSKRKVGFVPTLALKWSQDGGKGVQDMFNKMSPQVRTAALDGLRHVEANRQLALSRSLTPRSVLTHFVWAMLSKSQSPFNQESGFIDIEHNIPHDIQYFIDKTLQGNFSKDEYLNWLERGNAELTPEDAKEDPGHVGVLPSKGQIKRGKYLERPMVEDPDKAYKGLSQSSPGSGATSNLHDIADMLETWSDNPPATKKFVGLFNDPDVTGEEARRQFWALGFGGKGVNNKILSFAIAMLGKPDLMVIDLWQAQAYHPEAFDKLEQNYRAAKQANGPMLDKNGKPKKDNAKSAAIIATCNPYKHPAGLAAYEGLEDLMREALKGLPVDKDGLIEGKIPPSIFALHWLSWVAKQDSAVGHRSLDTALAMNEAGLSSRGQQRESLSEPPSSDERLGQMGRGEVTEGTPGRRTTGTTYGRGYVQAKELAELASLVPTEFEPGKDSTEFDHWLAGQSPETKREYADGASRHLEGQFRKLAAMRGLALSVNEGMGGFNGNANANSQAILVPIKDDMTPEQTEAAVRAFSTDLGYTFRQRGAVYGHPVPYGASGSKTAFDFQMSRPLTEREAISLAYAVKAEMANGLDHEKVNFDELESGFSFIPGNNRIRFVNYSEYSSHEYDDDEYIKRVGNAVKLTLGDAVRHTSDGTPIRKRFGWIGSYEGNNWAEDPEGHGYDKPRFGGDGGLLPPGNREDVEGVVGGIRRALEAYQEEFRKKREKVVVPFPAKDEEKPATGTTGVAKSLTKTLPLFLLLKADDNPADSGLRNPSLPQHPAPSLPVRSEWIHRGAVAYVRHHHIAGDLPSHPYAPLHQETSKRIADAFDAMKHEPNHPAVKEAYHHLAKEVGQQYDWATKKMGMKFEPWKHEGQPYANSEEMRKDVAQHHHLYFFTGGDMPSNHPMAQIDPKTGLSHNDKFRAVHDFFAHAHGGYEFGPRGEENAWIEHRKMFSDKAIPALTSETRGQNSWVNFGKHLRRQDGTIPKKGEPGFVHPTERPFAEQKAGLLPKEFHGRQDVPSRPAYRPNYGGGAGQRAPRLFGVRHEMDKSSADQEWHPEELLVKSHSVKRPGSRGGHPWLDKRGQWQYGPHPQAGNAMPHTAAPSGWPKGLGKIEIHDQGFLDLVDKGHFNLTVVPDKYERDNVTAIEVAPRLGPQHKPWTRMVSGDPGEQRETTGWFDSERAELKVRDIIPADSDTRGFTTYTVDLKPGSEWHEEITGIPGVEKDYDKYLWRGISYEEMEDIKRKGYIASNGSMNMQGEEGLTLTAKDPKSAAAYAGSFAPTWAKPTFDRPSFVLKIRKPDESRLTHDSGGENYVGVKGRIPVSDVLGVYEDKPYAVSRGVGTLKQGWSGEYEWTGGGGDSYSAWKQIDAPWGKGLGKSQSVAEDVKAPGSKGGHPWLNPHTHHWQYGPKPKWMTEGEGSSKPTQGGSPVVSGDDKTVPDNVFVSAKNDYPQRYLVVKKVGADGSVSYREYYGGLDGKPEPMITVKRDRWDNAIAKRKIKFFDSMKNIMKNNEPEDVAEYKGLHVGNVYFNETTSTYFHIVGMYRVPARPWMEEQVKFEEWYDREGKEPVGASIDAGGKIVDGQARFLHDDLTDFGKRDLVLAATPKAGGGFDFVHHPDMELKTIPKGGDVYFDTTSGKYYHVNEVRGEGMAARVSLWTDYNFDQKGRYGEYSEEESFVPKLWNDALSRRLRLVTEPMPPKYPMEDVREGQVYKDERTGGFVYVDKVDQERGKVHYISLAVRPLEEADVNYSSDGDTGFYLKETWERLSWSKKLVDTLDTTPVVPIDYCVGDRFNVRTSNGSIENLRVYYVTPEKLYMVATDSDGREYHRAELRIDADRGMARNRWERVALGGVDDTDAALDLDALPEPPQMSDYTPPSPPTYRDETVQAKARVCAALYHRLKTNKAFWYFAQQSFPGPLGEEDREDAGLPEFYPNSTSDTPPDGDAEKQGKVYLAVRRLVHAWAITSADTNAKSQCVQRAVRDEFGLQGCWDSMSSVDYTRIEDNEEDARKAFSALVDHTYSRYAPAFRAFVRAQYDETQAFLKQKGYSKIVLYRGVANASKYVDISPGSTSPLPTQVILQPQSAFTTAPYNAVSFASDNSHGVVYRTVLPVERCISTAMSGVGCYNEHEVTVLGGKPETMDAYSVKALNEGSVYLDEDGPDNGSDIWKSILHRGPHPIDATSQNADWLHHRSHQGPHPLDADIHNADWTKRTADIPRHELMRTLRYFGISHKEFSRLPAAAAYRHMRPRSTRKSHEALTYWLQKSRKGHDVSQEARNERGEWATSASMATPPTGARAVDDVAENPRIGDNIETANGTRYNVIGFGKDDHRRRGVKLYVLPSPDAPSVFSKPMVMTISIEAWREDCREEGSTVTPVQGDAPSFKDKPPKPPKPAPTTPPAPKTIAPGASLPESTALPGSTPVSAAISLPKSAGSDSLKVALAAIDRVHGDGVLPTLPVLITSAKSREGAYTYNPLTGKPGKIMVSRTADNLAYTFVHEIGHFLDQQALGRGKFASDSSSEVVPGMNKWYDAVKNSEAYKGLKALSYRTGIDVVGPDGKRQWYKLDSRYIRYLCLPSEAFARSYSQYVAMKSGDPELLAGLEEDRKDKGALHYSVQWQDEDFKPIADALDELFRGLGWMK